MFVDVYNIRINNLLIPARIGVYDHEKKQTQDILLNVDLQVRRGSGDHYPSVVCYDEIVQDLKSIALEEHWELAETLTNEMLNHCLQQERVMAVKIALAKLAPVQGSESVAIVMERAKPSTQT